MIHSEEHFDMYQIQRGDSDKEESEYGWHVNDVGGGKIIGK